MMVRHPARRLASSRLAMIVIPLALVAALLAPTTRVNAQGSYRVHLPLVTGDAARPTTPPPLDCRVPNASYDAVLIEGSPTDRPAEQHADMNLALRGYQRVDAALTLMDYNGDRHPAPQLYGLFADARTPAFVAAYRVFQWDWSCNCRRDSFEEPYPVSVLGLETTRGEPIRVPDREGGAISAQGHKTLVLYASEERVTLKYTREDTVVSGYTVHIEGICVDPNLLAFYRALNQQGRAALPALYAGQVIGYASGSELPVVIRDSGMWMDPRSRKDWWYGR